MALISENELKVLKSRDAAAVTAVVQQNTQALLNAAYGLGVRDPDAEELVQETFAAFLGGLDRFEGRSSVRTWLFGILYRKALERWRKDKREEATDPVDVVFDKRFMGGMWSAPPKGPDEEAVSSETAALIEECAEGLTAGQRAAFYLKEVEALPTQEVCNALEVSATNLRVLLFRARNKLRECLERKWGKA